MQEVVVPQNRCEPTNMMWDTEGAETHQQKKAAVSVSLLLQRERKDQERAVSVPEELEVDHTSQYGQLHDDDDPQQQLVGNQSVRRPEAHVSNVHMDKAIWWLSCCV